MTRGAALLALLLLGCAGPGSIDGALVGAARTSGSTKKMKLRLAADGSVGKISVYHANAELVPKAVRAATDERFVGATVLSYELELYRDAGRIYEVEVTTADGRRCELAAREDGSLFYEECEVPLEQLDAKVREALAELLPGGEIVELETKKGPERDELSIEVKLGDELHYVVARPDGTVLGHYLRVPAQIDLPIAENR